MNYFTLHRLGYLLFLCFMPTLLAFQMAPDLTSPEKSQEIIDYAQKNLQLQGTLMMNPDGFGYLKVDDKYIHTLFPMLGLQPEGFREPPYFRSATAPGAHISVFYVNEHIRPDELGQSFPFELGDIRIVHAGKAEYAVLQVKAPELEKLREKYSLSPKLFGHEFHISIAKKI